MSEETRRVADYAVRLRYEDLPPEVLERAKNTIADTIGAMIYGYELPWSITRVQSLEKEPDLAWLSA